MLSHHIEVPGAAPGLHGHGWSWEFMVRHVIHAGLHGPMNTHRTQGVGWSPGHRLGPHHWKTQHN